MCYTKEDQEQEVADCSMEENAAAALPVAPEPVDNEDPNSSYSKILEAANILMMLAQSGGHRASTTCHQEDNQQCCRERTPSPCPSPIDPSPACSTPLSTSLSRISSSPDSEFEETISSIHSNSSFSSAYLSTSRSSMVFSSEVTSDEDMFDENFTEDGLLDDEMLDEVMNEEYPIENPEGEQEQAQEPMPTQERLGEERPRPDVPFFEAFQDAPVIVLPAHLAPIPMIFMRYYDPLEVPRPEEQRENNTEANDASMMDCSSPITPSPGPSSAQSCAPRKQEPEE